MQNQIAELKEQLQKNMDKFEEKFVPLTEEIKNLNIKILKL